MRDNGLDVKAFQSPRFLRFDEDRKDAHWAAGCDL